MVIRPANRVLIDVCKLRFNPRGVKPLLMQNGAHRVAETVPRQPAFISQQFDNLINAFLADRLARIIPADKNQRVMP